MIFTVGRHTPSGRFECIRRIGDELRLKKRAICSNPTDIIKQKKCEKIGISTHSTNFSTEFV